MKPILQKEALTLRDIAQDVPIKAITSLKIKKILKEMKTALASQDDGVAIAAPQIGYGLRIFVISSRFLPKKKSVEENPLPLQDLVFINPKILKLSKEKKEMEEGCLSVRYLYGKVSRSQKATVEAYDEYGNKFIKGGSGLMAQVFQHEVDHLNGVLFIDKAKFIQEIIPTHLASHSKKHAGTKK